MKKRKKKEPNKGVLQNQNLLRISFFDKKIRPSTKEHRPSKVPITKSHGEPNDTSDTFGPGNLNKWRGFVSLPKPAKAQNMFQKKSPHCKCFPYKKYGNPRVAKYTL